MQEETIQQVFDEMPQEVDVDIFLKKLYLQRKIAIAERQLAGGEGIPHEEAKRRMSKRLG